MKKSYLFLIGVFVIILTAVAVYSYTTTYSYRTYTCYQETATQNTSCGGLDTGTYAHAEQQGYYTLDGYFYVNYTKPTNYTTALWQIKYGDGRTINATIPDSCYNFQNNTLSFLIVASSGFGSSGTIGYCLNNTGWVTIAPSVSCAVMGYSGDHDINNTLLMYDGDWSTLANYNSVDYDPAWWDQPASGVCSLIFEEGITWGNIYYYNISTPIDPKPISFDCNQETANISTQCGNDNLIGSYSVGDEAELTTGVSPTFYQWNARPLLIDYKKPLGATSAQWKLKHGNYSEYFVDIPYSCFNYNTTAIKLKFKSFDLNQIDGGYGAIPTNYSYSMGYCYDGSWQLITKIANATDPNQIRLNGREAFANTYDGNYNTKASYDAVNVYYWVLPEFYNFTSNSYQEIPDRASRLFEEKIYWKIIKNESYFSVNTTSDNKTSDLLNVSGIEVVKYLRIFRNSNIFNAFMDLKLNITGANNTNNITFVEIGDRDNIHEFNITGNNTYPEKKIFNYSIGVYPQYTTFYDGGTYNYTGPSPVNTSYINDNNLSTYSVFKSPPNLNIGGIIVWADLTFSDPRLLHSTSRTITLYYDWLNATGGTSGCQGSAFFNGYAYAFDSIQIFNYTLGNLQYYLPSGFSSNELTCGANKSMTISFSDSDEFIMNGVFKTYMQSFLQVTASNQTIRIKELQMNATVQSNHLDFKDKLTSILANSCSNCTQSGSYITVPITFYSQKASVNYINYSNLNIDYTTNPYITLTSPTNNSARQTSFNLTCNIDELLPIINATVYVWNSSNSVVFTNNTEINGTYNYNFTNSLNLSDGTYKWNCLAFNTEWRSSYAFANNTIRVDSVAPNISFVNPFVTSGNYSRTSIWANISSSDNATTVDEMILYLYDQNGLYNSSSTNDQGGGGGAITRRYFVNFTSVPNGIYTIVGEAVDSAGNRNSTNITNILLDTTGPNVTLYSPVAQNYLNNNSIGINFSITDAFQQVDKCWFKVYNSSTILYNNVTITNCTNTTFSMPGADLGYTFTFYANDSLNNLRTINVAFGIRTNKPNIVLNYPTDNKYLNYNNNIPFNFTPSTNYNLSVCKLYSNFNANNTWGVNHTFTNTTKNVVNTLLRNISDGTYLWNIWCNDTNANEDNAISNYTFTIDTIYPQILIESIAATAGSQTISFNTTTYDVNNITCRYTILNDTGGIDGTNQDVAFSCGGLSSATVTKYGNYTLWTYAIDGALNENNSYLNFSTSPSQAVIIIGGAGGGTPVAGNATWEMITSTGSTEYNLQMSANEIRTRQLIFINRGISARDVVLTCEGNLCPFMVFENNSIRLPANSQISQEINFRIELENASSNTTYSANIIGTDQTGAKRFVNVNVEVGALGNLFSLVGKTADTTDIFGIKIPNILIVLLVAVIIYFGVNTFLKKRTDLAPVIALLTAGVIGLLSLLFV